MKFTCSPTAQKYARITAILIAVVGIGPLAKASLVSSFVKNPSTCHFYALVDRGGSWTDAQTDAQTYGGNLVTINDQQEQEWVYNQFSNFAGINRYLWIGLTDKDSVGTFKWISGDPITYTNWLAGEPNGQHYVHMWSPDSAADAGKWNDNDVSVPGFEFAGVVEVAVNVLTSAVNPANGHTYYLIDPSDKSWLTAEAQAQILGGHLASINDAQEQNWVYGQFSNFGGVKRYLWIGLTDKDSSGTFVWTNGDPVTFTNWTAGEPNGQHYVHMWSPDSGSDAGKWNDNNVSVPGFEFAGVVEITTSIKPTPTPKPKPNGQLIAKYLKQYLQLKQKLIAAKRIHNIERRKKAVRKIQKEITRVKELLKKAQG